MYLHILPKFPSVPRSHHLVLHFEILLDSPSCSSCSLIAWNQYLLLIPACMYMYTFIVLSCMFFSYRSHVLFYWFFFLVLFSSSLCNEFSIDPTIQPEHIQQVSDFFRLLPLLSNNLWKKGKVLLRVVDWSSQEVVFEIATISIKWKFDWLQSFSFSVELLESLIFLFYLVDKDFEIEVMRKQIFFVGACVG